MGSDNDEVVDSNVIKFSDILDDGDEYGATTPLLGSSMAIDSDINRYIILSMLALC